MKQILFTILLALILYSPSARAQSTNIFNAARANDVKVVQALIDKKTDVNQIDERGYTALILATYNGSSDVADLLLQHGASPEVKDPMGRTALMGAAFQGDAQSIELLLDHGAKVNDVDANGATSLMYAVEFGRKSVVKLLIARNADPYMKDKRGFDAFYLAQQLDDPGILGILKQASKTD
jgi:uncharacterized protein